MYFRGPHGRLALPNESSSVNKANLLTIESKYIEVILLLQLPGVLNLILYFYRRDEYFSRERSLRFCIFFFFIIIDLFLLQQTVLQRYSSNYVEAYHFDS